MKKEDKIIIICYMILALTIISIILFLNEQYSIKEEIIPEKLKVVEFKIIKNTDVNIIDLFNVMADIENYPKILPENYVFVKILNQSNRVIFSEETVKEKGLEMKMLVKHSILPYEGHSIEILDGNAKYSFLQAKFENNNSSNKLTVYGELNLTGNLSPFKFVPINLIENYVDSKLTRFIDKARIMNNENKKIIDDLYLEILYRHADKDGLEYYASLLEAKKMTVEDIRKVLLESDEFKTIKPK